MKNKIFLNFSSIALILAILLTAFPVVSLAEQTKSDEQKLYADTNSFIDYNSKNVDVPYFNKYQINSAGYWNYDNINISKENGFMSYSFSLFNLQNTNDLNIDLGLRFDSDSSDISNEAKDSDLITNTFDVTETREYYKTSDDTRAKELDKTIQYEDETDLYTWKSINPKEKKYTTVYGVSYYYYRKISIKAKASDISNESFSNFYDSRYNLGAGWSFNLPSIEIIKGTDENVGEIKYFHTSNGEKYKINYLNKLEGYYLDNIIVNNAVNNEFTVGSTQAKYRIINADGSKEYFDEQGRYIGKIDKFDNKIKVSYSNDLIESITEPTGRKLKFEYQTNENTRTVTGTLVDNASANADSKTIFILNQKFDETNNCFKLISIKDAINRTISFDYSVSNNNITFGNDTYKSKTLLLKSITNYNGLYLGIDYTNKKTSYGLSGIKEYQAVSKCYKKETKSGNVEKEVNTFDYQYEDTLNWRFNENECYPLIDDSTMKVTKSVEESSTSQMKYESTINAISRNIKDREYLYTSSGDTNKIEDISTVEYSGFSANNIPFVTLSKTLGKDDNFLFTRNEDVYDSYGNVTSSIAYSGTGYKDYLKQYVNINSKSESKYDYSVSKDTPIISAEYTKQEKDNVFAKVTFNTINNKNKITKSVVKTFDMSNVTDLSSLTTATPVKKLTETNYTYSNSGNLTKEEVIDLTDEEKTQKHTTKYTYDSKYNAYIARKEQTDILNINGGSNFNINGSPSIVTKSNYDMFGNEIASFDAYGNETIKTYNAIGDLIKTQAYSSPYKTVYDWEKEKTGSSYPDISGFNSDTSKWSGNFTVIDDVSRLNSGSTKGIKIKNKVNYQTDCRVALDVPEELMKNSLGLRFFAAPSKKNGGIKVSFKDYSTINYDVYSTSDTNGGWIDISWNGRMYKNGVDVWEWTNGTVKDLRKTKTIWITFQNMAAGAEAYLDDIQVLVANEDRGLETLTETSVDYKNNITETVNKDGTGSKTVTDNFGNTIQTYEKMADGDYKVTSESSYDNNNRVVNEKSYVTDKLYTVTKSEYNKRGELSKTTVTDNENKKLSETLNSNEVVSLDNTLYNLSYQKIVKGTTNDNKTTETYTYNNASGQTIKTKTVSSFVDGDYAHKTTNEDVNNYGSFGELLSNNNDESGKETYIQNSAGETVITGKETNYGKEVYETTVTDGFGQTISETDANLNSDIDITNVDSDNLDSTNGVLTKYDNAGRVIETKTPYESSKDGKYKYSVEQKFYDANGNVIREKKLIGYDKNNKEIFSEKINTYDAKNNIIMIEQKNGNESQFTQYYYDVNNRVIRIYSGLSKPLTINGADNVSPNGDNDYSVIKYTYDFYGNKSSYTDNHNKTEKYEYDKYSGTLNNGTKRDGTKVSYTYDVQGNVLTETAEKAGKDTVKKTYTYDYDNNKQTAVISKKSANGDEFVDEYKTTYNNNEKGAVYNEKTENFKTGNVINKAYQYDTKGNTTKLTVSKIANGAKTEMYSYSYTYYDDGKLATEKHIVAGATEQPVIKYTYDNNGNVVSKVLSNGSNENDVKVTSSYSYNLANECVTEVHNNGTGYNYEYSYTYTPDGNVLESSLSKKEKRIKTIYTYDRLNRLTSEEQQEYNKGDLIDEFKDVYSFDDYNNILKKVHAEDDTTKNSTVVSTYDKTRLLTQTETDSENNQSSQISYTYDDNGNMSSKVLVKGENTTETQLSYDGFDRTTGIKIGDVTTSFDYNTDSDRVSKTTNGKTTESILDNGSVSADLIGETLKVFSDDNSVFCQNGVFAYNVINTKGDIIALAGSNGIDYNYNAYGTELYNCSSANPIGYRNYYYDSETGLYYLKARYYDPTTGQFTQEDTVQDDNLQYNLYGYCSANPVLYTDPSGHGAVFNPGKAVTPGRLIPPGGVSLKRGSKGKNVKTMQNKLKKLSYYNDKIDSSFGPNTEKAVKTYQKDYGLKVDGRVYREAWSCLFDSSFIPDITIKLYKQMFRAECETSHIASFGYYALLDFKKLVQNKGRYDLKNKPGWKHKAYMFNGQLILNDGPGNILYGYLGKCFGYSDDVLRAGAGWAQIKAGTSVRREWLNWRNFGDDPRDTDMIELGIAIYHKTHK